MTLKAKDRILIAQSNLKKAKVSLDEAKKICDIAPGASSRSSYECAYFTIVALFIGHGIQMPKTHKGINEVLYDRFVRGGGCISKDIAALIGQLETDRNIVQYSADKYISKENAAKNAAKAEKFCTLVGLIVEEKISALAVEKEQTAFSELENSLGEEIKNLHLMTGEGKIYTKTSPLVNYEGEILHVDQEKGYSVQQIGSISLLVHRHVDLERVPEKGENLRILYQKNERAKMITMETVQQN